MKNDILEGRTSLGIELGSTRIKAIILNENHATIAKSEHIWENQFANGIWTYSIEDIWQGVQNCYKILKQNILNDYGVKLTTVGAIGISSMMHGYMVFDKNGQLLTPFRTWRNNNAQNAASELSELFDYHIPARWSIAHLYNAIQNNESHIKEIDFQTSLMGYIHFKLTGKKVIGIGEASGMFPIDTFTKQYNSKMVDLFNNILSSKKLPFSLLNIFPQILIAGDNAGFLTEKGSLLLDPDGDLKFGIPFCPPEGDAGTGMVATNSIKKGEGNVSAGTSIFSMVVLDKQLSKAHSEIDLVTTPIGELVAMIHCNNCTSEINSWITFFEEYNKLMKIEISKDELYKKLFSLALDGEKDCGGLIAYNYLSGENITEIDEGRPMLVRTTESRLNLPNFMRSQIYSAITTLKIGLDILLKEENIKINSLNAHGGIFKTEGVAQKFLAAAVNAPVTVTKSSNEGGAWGMAILAMYSIKKDKFKSLDNYLDEAVFINSEKITLNAQAEDVDGINKYTENFRKGLTVVKQAVKALKGVK